VASGIREGRLFAPRTGPLELAGILLLSSPGWARRGQVKVWLDADNPDAGRTDFAAAAGADLRFRHLGGAVPG